MSNSGHYFPYLSRRCCACFGWHGIRRRSYRCDFQIYRKNVCLSSIIIKSINDFVITLLISFIRFPVEIADSLELTRGVTGQLTFEEVDDDFETAFVKTPSGIALKTRRVSAMRNLGVRSIIFNVPS